MMNNNIKILKNYKNWSMLHCLDNVHLDLQFFASTEIFMQIEDKIKAATEGDQMKGIKPNPLGIKELELIKDIGIHDPLPEFLEYTKYTVETDSQEMIKKPLIDVTGNEWDQLAHEEFGGDNEKLSKATGLSNDIIEYFNFIFGVLNLVELKVIRYNFGKEVYLILNKPGYVDSTIHQLSTIAGESSDTVLKLGANNSITIIKNTIKAKEDEFAELTGFNDSGDREEMDSTFDIDDEDPKPTQENKTAKQAKQDNLLSIVEDYEPEGLNIKFDKEETKTIEKKVEIEEEKAIEEVEEETKIEDEIEEKDDDEIARQEEEARADEKQRKEDEKRDIQIELQKKSKLDKKKEEEINNLDREFFSIDIKTIRNLYLTKEGNIEAIRERLFEIKNLRELTILFPDHNENIYKKLLSEYNNDVEKVKQALKEEKEMQYKVRDQNLRECAQLQARMNEIKSKYIKEVNENGSYIINPKAEILLQLYKEAEEQWLESEKNREEFLEQIKIIEE
ncbi:hypothetical protein ACFL20_03900 [Spirochaetota bacterium]